MPKMVVKIADLTLYKNLGITKTYLSCILGSKLWFGGLFMKISWEMASEISQVWGSSIIIMPGTVGCILLPLHVIHVYCCCIKIYNSISYNSMILFGVALSCTSHKCALKGAVLLVHIIRTPHRFHQIWTKLNGNASVSNSNSRQIWNWWFMNHQTSGVRLQNLYSWTSYIKKAILLMESIITISILIFVCLSKKPNGGNFFLLRIFYDLCSGICLSKM